MPPIHHAPKPTPWMAWMPAMSAGSDVSRVADTSDEAQYLDADSTIQCWDSEPHRRMITIGLFFVAPAA